MFIERLLYLTLSSYIIVSVNPHGVEWGAQHSIASQTKDITPTWPTFEDI